MEIFTVQKDCWSIFKHYHYLTSSIPSNAKCYIGFINYEPVCFVAMSFFPHPHNTNIYKVSRVVTLPHWQNYGIGMKMVEKICEQEYEKNSIHFTSTLPIIHQYLHKSNKWLLKSQGNQKVPNTGKIAKKCRFGVYMETYKFINDAINEKDLNISYNDMNENVVKNNNHKMDIILDQIKQNELIIKEVEVEVEDEISNFFELI